MSAEKKPSAAQEPGNLRDGFPPAPEPLLEYTCRVAAIDCEEERPEDVDETTRFRVHLVGHGDVVVSRSAARGLLVGDLIRVTFERKDP